MKRVPKRKPRTCPKCDGEGDVKGYDPGGFPAMVRCRECGGNGTTTGKGRGKKP